MEEVDLPPPDSVTRSSNVSVSGHMSEPDDSGRALQLKHDAMLERLANLDKSRRAQKTSSDSPSTESAQSFLARFNRSKLSIESKLSSISSASGNSHSDPNNSAKSELENVAVSISDLEKLVAENSYFLPSYEIGSCLKSITDLRQLVDEVTSQVIPKRKFSFRNKKKSSTLSLPQIDVVIGDESSKKSVNDAVNGGLSGFQGSSPGFRDKQGEILERKFDKGDQIGEFSLTELKDCEVRLKGCIRSVFVNKLTDCRVYVGPVFGSVLMEEVERCVFVLASHQIRIHKAKDCDFYLRVRSRPIIEECKGVMFAPYCLRYDGIEEDLEQTNLNEETGNWANVDDFRWLRAMQSPNWKVLPENERVAMVDISN